jgi:hypothetical protein
LAQFKKHWQEEDNVENINEIGKFLVDGCEDSNDDKLDILGWWKCNVSKYNILLKVAQNVLVIPISTVAFKLAFSTDSYILNQFQSSLSIEIVQTLICCQNRLRYRLISIDIRNLIKDFETYEHLKSSNFSYKFKLFIL